MTLRTFVGPQRIRCQNARLDLPDPETPDMTTNFPLGISTSMSRRLCVRAPLTTIQSSLDAPFFLLDTNASPPTVDFGGRDCP